MLGTAWSISGAESELPTKIVFNPIAFAPTRFLGISSRKTQVCGGGPCISLSAALYASGSGLLTKFKESVFVFEENVYLSFKILELINSPLVELFKSELNDELDRFSEQIREVEVNFEKLQNMVEDIKTVS